MTTDTDCARCGHDAFDHAATDTPPVLGRCTRCGCTSYQRPLTYGDLPTSPPTSVGLYCPGCGDGPFSATRGDYFTCADDAPITCGDCGDPMVLGRRVVTIDPVDPATLTH